MAAWMIVGIGTTVVPGVTANCPLDDPCVRVDGGIGSVPDCVNDPYETCAWAEVCRGSPSDPDCLFTSTEETETVVNDTENFVSDQLDRIVVDITFGAPSPLLTVAVPFPTNLDVPVAGYVDRYAFFGGSVVLPCVVLTASGSPNPCATAGGVFVSRVLTIVDTSFTVPLGRFVDVPVAISTCTHRVTVLVEGFGLNQFPVTAVC